jgi:hypothetical protein
MQIFGNTLSKTLTMKNILFCTFLLFVSLLSCKKEPKENSLIRGLDPTVKLPNADTTNAFAFIEGYIDGERFCLVSKKDSVEWIDYASALFCCDFQKEWVNGIGGSWYFEQPETWNKRWYIQFILPTFDAVRDKNEYTNFRKKYSTPNSFNNFYTGKPNSGVDNFSLNVFRTDIINGTQGTSGLTSWGDVKQGVPLDQTGSFIKLVSITKMDPVKSGGYNYQLIYEFDLKLLSGNGVLHLTKGRMKTWIENLKQ